MSASGYPTIEVRNYVDNVRYMRRSSFDLGAYEDLVSHCFSAFNYQQERFSVHFHFRRDTLCEGLRLLEEGSWDAGVYDIGGDLTLYAHFITRPWSRSDERRGYVARESTTPSDVSSPDSPWVQPPLPSVGERSLLVPGYQAADPVPGDSGSTPTTVSPPAPLLPPPAIGRPISRPPATQRRNTNSTTFYSICTLIPATRYGTAAYFSAPFIFIPLPPSPPRPRSHPQRYSNPFPGFRPELSSPTIEQTATAMTSNPARRLPSAPAAIGSRSLASQPQPDDRFPDQPPVTRRGRPRNGEQTVRFRSPVADRFDFPLEFADNPPARQTIAPRTRARATEQPALPPRIIDPYDFPLDFNDGPIIRGSPPQLQPGEEDEELEVLPGDDESVSGASSMESFEFPLEVDVSPPASQQEPEQEQPQQEEQEQEVSDQESRASVARSEDSFRQFAPEQIESPLFVTDESDKDFNKDLVWETDNEEGREEVQEERGDEGGANVGDES